MSGRKNKIVKIELDVAVPSWMTVAQVRTEVRTRINEATEHHGMIFVTNAWQDVYVRVRKLSARQQEK